MRILSINAFQPNSAAACIEDGIITGAYYEQHLSRLQYDRSFPDLSLYELRNPYKDYDKVILSVPQTYKATVEKLKNRTNASPTLVDHREALAMSAIITNRWNNCAVLVVDTFHTSIGYYSDNSFYWLRDYQYPNSLCLFYSAATRFLGYKPIVEEHLVEKLAKQGNPIFADYILNNVIKVTDNSYDLLLNLERGAGAGAANADIACSVQHVFEKAIIALGNETKKLLKTDNIIFVGKGSTNVGATTALFSIFDKVATCVSQDAGASVLGAAALVENLIWENYNLGTYDSSRELADDYIKDLLKGYKVPFIEGKQAFSLNSLGSRSLISLPYIEHVNEDSIAIVEKHRFSEFFEKGTDNATSYCTMKKKVIPTVDKIRCLTVTSSSNPKLSRLLKITTEQGYPALIYNNLGSTVIPKNCYTYKREKSEI